MKVAKYENEFITLYRGKNIIFSGFVNQISWEFVYYVGDFVIEFGESNYNFLTGTHKFDSSVYRVVVG